MLTSRDINGNFEIFHTPLLCFQMEISFHDGIFYVIHPLIQSSNLVSVLFIANYQLNFYVTSCLGTKAIEDCDD